MYAALDCGLPPDVSYAQKHFTNTTYGSSVTYTCHTGYAFDHDVNMTSWCNVTAHDDWDVSWTVSDGMTSCSGKFHT